MSTGALRRTEPEYDGEKIGAMQQQLDASYMRELEWTFTLRRRCSLREASMLFELAGVAGPLILEPPSLNKPEGG